MKKNNNRIIAIVLILLLFLQNAAYCEGKETENPKIEKILSSLTLEEKVSLCSGGGSCFKGIPRLKIPEIKFTDGPRGPNAQVGTTAFPCGILFGATWDPSIVEKAGKVMGEEARALGRSILLGPGMNILRDPLGGRFFEYYTEDPFLNAAIAVGQIKGIQSEGIAACAKHFVCNNREDNRNFYMSVLDDRTLHEIYLPAFKAAVRQADVATIMTSANGVDYEFVSDSRKLLTDILKDRWGFRGFVMTDWLQTRSVEKAAFAGLDVSMPGGDNCGFGSALLQAVKEGRVSILDINDKVRRILGVYERVGALEGIDIRKGARINTEEHQAVAREIAQDGIVLLKNRNNILPLRKDKIKHILVTGPNADKRFCLLAMGGSSWVESPYEITVLKGLRNLLGKDKVTYVSSDDLGGFQSIPENVLEPIDGTKGFQGKYFIKGKQDPVLSRIDKSVDFMWEMKSPDKSIPVDDFREARFEARIIPPADGKYSFRLTAGGGSAIAYDNEWGGAPMAIADPSRGTGTVTAAVDLKKGIPFHLCIVYSKNVGDAAIRLEWETPQSGAAENKLRAIDKIARKADAVVFVGGIDNNLDTEGRDRSSLTFPLVQEKLIRHLAKINKNTHVVLINGSPLEIGGWLPDAASLIEAWYPGMEGGNAVADILFGKTNPSGRLPFTWPKKLSDVPCFKLGFQNNDEILYTDKLMVGYRYYDTKNVEPQFPFGYGLSYSRFSYSNPKAEKTGENTIEGSVQISNTGKTDGYETLQIYIKPLSPSVDRPVHELKFFKKVFLKAGQSIVVPFLLNQDAFSFYDVHSSAWKVDRGKYLIEFGKNSREILTSVPIEI